MPPTLRLRRPGGLILFRPEGNGGHVVDAGRLVLHAVVHRVFSAVVKTSTLTIRLSIEQRQMLKRSAKALKKTESEFIRDLIARDLDVRTLGERVGHLAGSIDSSKRTPRAADSFRETIRRHNWRPN